MMVTDGIIPEFYKAYVGFVQEAIERNATLEFECLWREHESSKEPLSVLSDELSLTIRKLSEDLQNGDELWKNEPLRKLVLSEAIPLILIQKIGSIDLLLSRLPEPYQRALFGSYLASRFIYQHGINPSQFAFFEFMVAYFNKLS